MSEYEPPALLVAISSSPHSELLVKRTMELAKSLSASWLALHVDTGKPKNPADTARIEERLEQARTLGAQTAVVSDEDVAGRIVKEAKSRGCTIIVVGRSGLSNRGLRLFSTAISDRVVRFAILADVIVVNDKAGSAANGGRTDIRALFNDGPRQYALLIASFSTLLAAGIPLSRLIGYRPVSLLFLAAVMCLSLVLKPIPIAIFATASATALNFFLIPPYFTLHISLVDDVVLFTVYFLAAIVTSTLVSSVRFKTRLLKEKEERASFLSESLEILSSCATTAEAAKKAAGIAASHFDRRLFAYAVGPSGEVIIAAEPAEPANFVSVNDPDISAAKALLQDRAKAAEGIIAQTERCFFVPAAVRGKTLGVFGIEKKPGWTKADTDLLLALGRALALAIERQAGEQMKRTAAIAEESGRLSRVLFDAVSHELRTPLTTVTGVLSALGDKSFITEESLRDELISDGLAASDRLNSVVEDLLSASRIKSGKLRLQISPSELSEIASAAVGIASAETRGREVEIRLRGEETPVAVDPGLTARLAGNLLKNAGRHSRPRMPIDFSLTSDGKILVIEVGDQGPGLPHGMIKEPFGKYINNRTEGGGLGLGLSICEGIAKAHGGCLEILENSAKRFRIAAFIPLTAGAGTP